MNSVHGQAIDRLGEGLVVEALAPDGTVEAVRLAPTASDCMAGSYGPGCEEQIARGGNCTWVLGVQWHPEWRYAENPDSVAIFRAFGHACRSLERERSSSSGRPRDRGQAAARSGERLDRSG